MQRGKFHRLYDYIVNISISDLLKIHIFKTTFDHHSKIFQILKIFLPLKDSIITACSPYRKTFHPSIKIHPVYKKLLNIVQKFFKLIK